MTYRFSTLLALIFLLVIVGPLTAQTQTSEYAETPITGPETWKTNQGSYTIEGTGLLEGRVFIVRAIVDFLPTVDDEDYALDIARFALVMGYRDNAKHVRYFNSFSEVDETHIGVALIYQRPDGRSTGYRFMFESDNVLGRSLREGVMSPPRSLADQNSVDELNVKLWNLLYHENTDQLLQLFHPDIRVELERVDYRTQFGQLSSVVQSMRNIGFSHWIFVGNMVYGRAFNYFFWVEDEGQKGFFRVTLSEVDGQLHIIGLNIDASSFFE